MYFRIFTYKILNLCIFDIIAVTENSYLLYTVNKGTIINEYLMTLCDRYPSQTGSMPGPYGPPGSAGPSVSQQSQYAPPNGQHMM